VELWINSRRQAHIYLSGKRVSGYSRHYEGDLEILQGLANKFGVH
jgi:hypothetical protein